MVLPSLGALGGASHAAALHRAVVSRRPRAPGVIAAGLPPKGSGGGKPKARGSKQQMRSYEVDPLGERELKEAEWKPKMIRQQGDPMKPLDSSLIGDDGELSESLVDVTTAMLSKLGIPVQYPAGDPSRGIFCSRTLNLKGVKALGYDMDYTLIHYNVTEWEGTAYKYGLENLRATGLPVDGLKFDPNMVIRGLIVDKVNGNIVKADRFGYVKRAMHGTRMLNWNELHNVYGRELIDLRKEDRWEFLNTLFSVSQACMYMQMVDRLDEGYIEPYQIEMNGYLGLHRAVSAAAFRTHVEGKLKRDVMGDPKRFVEPDPALPATLLDQRDAGKKVLLITNSDYEYTDRMMSFSYDPYLPAGMKWRDLFHMVICSADKPGFFGGNANLYEVVTEDGLLRPSFKVNFGGLYCGGSAKQVERALGVGGDDIMYVGDHIYTDVSIAKINLRWRTCLIVRELEDEVEAMRAGKSHRASLKNLMAQKECVSDVFNQIRLAASRKAANRAPQVDGMDLDEEECERALLKLQVIIDRLDEMISVKLAEDGSLFNKQWGYLSIAGLNDKSHLTRQIEKYADIYTSRVSNFLRYTPYMYFRSPSQSLAHDRKKSRSWKDMEREQMRSLKREIKQAAFMVGQDRVDSDTYGWAVGERKGKETLWPEIQARWVQERKGFDSFDEEEGGEEEEEAVEEGGKGAGGSEGGNGGKDDK